MICLLSAAVYYHLTTFIPDAVDVAIPRKAKVSTIPDWPRINVHYYTDERYELGVTTVREGRNAFRIYDIEKLSWILCFTKRKSGLKKPEKFL